MPAPFGVTAAGFNRPTQREIIALFEGDQLAEMDPDIDVSTDSVLGQLNGIYSRPIDKLWQELQTIFHAFDPDAAEAFLLDFLGKLTGTGRRGAASSETKCTIVADEGTVLEAGVNFASVASKPDVRFTPKARFTAVGAGPYLGVLFRSEQTGPVEAPTGTLTVIATPVSGWTSITNADDAAGGRVADDDPTLRFRREEQLTRAGSSTLDAIRADLIAVDGIESVEMFENVSDSFDANGLPPHSYEAVIWDRDPAAADNDAIAQALWDSNARSTGALHGTATDKLGKPQVVSFSRATVRDVWLDIDLEPRDGYIGDTAFADQLTTECNKLFGNGQSVDAYDVATATKGFGAKVPTIRLGFAPSPTLTVDLPVGIREIPRFDSARITLHHV